MGTGAPAFHNGSWRWSGRRDEAEEALAKAATEHSRIMDDTTRRHADQVAALRHSAAADQDAAQRLLQQTIAHWTAKHTAEVARLDAQHATNMATLQSEHSDLVAQLHAAVEAKEETFNQATKRLMQQNSEKQQAADAMALQKASVDAILETTKDALAQKAMDMTNTMYRCATCCMGCFESCSLSRGSGFLDYR
jgi:hypothetical protein